MMRWHEQYLGKPWEICPRPPVSFNCGELVRHIYRVHFGYTPPPLAADLTSLRSCLADVGNIGRYYPGMVEVVTPRDFDIAMMGRGGPSAHVGLFCGADILHCRPDCGVVLESFFTLKASGWTNIKFMRLEGLTLCM